MSELSKRDQAYADAYRCLDDIQAALSAYEESPNPAAKWLVDAGLRALPGRIERAMQAQEEPQKPKRQLVVDIARSQIGKSDPGVYWAAVLPKTARPPYPKHWCGAGYLWCLHQAGIATNVQWRIGLGLSGAMQRAGLSFPTTKSPQPGDMAYFTRNQHHAVVVVESGGLVRVVNFNGAGDRVTESLHTLAEVAAFFSIANLIGGAQP